MTHHTSFADVFASCVAVMLLYLLCSMAIRLRRISRAEQAKSDALYADWCEYMPLHVRSRHG